MGRMPRCHSSWWYGGRCRLKKDDKNDRIDEEKSDDETKYSMSTTVNNGEWPDLTPSVDMEEGVGKTNMTRMI